MNLQNGEYFGIVRQLPDPNDSGTYYVQAEIRAADTDELLERVTLVDRGSRRFSVPWLVNAKRDGAFISIMTAVYTDAAFTTPSDAYSQEIQTYLVETRNLGGGGGGGGISEKRIKELMKEAVAPILKAVEDLEVEDIDYAGLMDGATKLVLEAIDREGTKNTRTILMSISDIDVKPKVTVPDPVVDMKPVTTEMKRISAESEARFERLVRPVKALLDNLESTTKRFVDTSNGLDKQASRTLPGLRDELLGAVDDIREMLATAAEANAGAIRTSRASREPSVPAKTPAELIRELRSGAQ